LKLQGDAVDDSYSLKEIRHHQIFPLEDEVLILSFTWYPHGNQNPPSLALTLNTGAVHVIRFTNWDFDSYLTEHGPVNMHSQKAESCAWSPYSKDPTLPTCKSMKRSSTTVANPQQAFSRGVMMSGNLRYGFLSFHI